MGESTVSKWLSAVDRSFLVRYFLPEELSTRCRQAITDLYRSEIT